MKKIFSILLGGILISTFLFISGCGLEPNYKNCRDAIKNSGLIYNSNVVIFNSKNWYVKEYPAKIMVGTHISHYGTDIQWTSSVACMTSNPGSVDDNGGYKYEAVFILGKDPTFTQKDINQINYRKNQGSPLGDLRDETIEEFGGDGLRFKYIGTNNELTQEQIDAILNFI